ncbi:TIR domain-containing protein [Phthorimaea operculella]|nr:TIR domain-containing protein [Phthorimaea operculella]
MLLFLFVFFILKHPDARVCLLICNDDAELYIHKGEIIQIKRINSSHIEMLTCSANVTQPMELDPERLLLGVSILNVREIAWPSLHLTSTLQQVTLNGMKSIGLWGDCSRLIHLKVVQGDPPNHQLAMVPPDWLSNCTKLRSLSLEHVSTSEIANVLDSTPKLKVLAWSHIVDLYNINRYPLLSSVKNPEISYFYATILYNSDPLYEHNITWTEISTSLMWQLSLMPLLEGIHIYGSSEYFDLCAAGNPKPVRFGSLKYVRLVDTRTQRFCFRNYYQAPQLNKITLLYNSQSRSVGFHLQVREMYSIKAPQLYVDLENRGQVLSFDFSRNDYLEMYDFQKEVTKKANLRLFGFKQFVKCDCFGPTSWFARALRAGLVKAPGVLCPDLSSPANMRCESLDCDRINCISSCICCREEQNTIWADCRDANLTALPEELLIQHNLTRLLAPNNKIIALPYHFPDTLLNLDLSGNNIWQAGSAQVGTLFTQPLRRVRLSRNYLLCSCENIELISQLHNNKYQIADYENITCAINNVKLKDINIEKLCELRDRDRKLIKQKETMLVAVIVSVVAAVAILVAAFILYQKRHELQIFLFAHGWCLSCITEDELDADRLYDVFISFCHDDTPFVSEKLLPQLDREYSVCVHLRDWVPGEMIPTQIKNSVEQSRRTIVVMSRRFIRSEWGRLEFQTAHMNGLAAGRIRVIMIILDDVLEKDELTPELRSYVRLNTYVRWDDPWFWEKLRYSLPHHPTPRVGIWTPPVRQQLEDVSQRSDRIQMRAIEGSQPRPREVRESELFGIVEEVE